jgi:TRAP-type mannitol/chloroaromatic compound transport system substrate-binding protein
LETNKEESEKTPIAKKVYASYSKFQAYITDWGKLSEGPYQNFIAG